VVILFLEIWLRVWDMVVKFGNQMGGMKRKILKGKKIIHRSMRIVCCVWGGGLKYVLNKHEHAGL